MNMKTILTVLTTVLFAPQAVSQAAETNRPNIIVILADDKY
jgi:hypothetical protein